MSGVSQDCQFLALVPCGAVTVIDIITTNDSICPVRARRCCARQSAAELAHGRSGARGDVKCAGLAGAKPGSCSQVLEICSNSI